ncbi:MAG: RDD family protein [Syntrophales bacterium]
MTQDKYGGFWRRAMAFLIDMIILYFISLVLFFIGFMAMHAGSVYRSPGVSLMEMMEGLAAPYYIVIIIIYMLYFIYFHGIAGQTPGKMILGLKVVRTTGDKMTLGIAFLRWVGYIISSLFLYLGFLWIAFDGKKQGWHDKIADTVVVRVVKEEYSNT